VRTRLFQSESFRHAAIYAVLFTGAMAVLITLVYLGMDQAFKADLLRASGDDLLAIRKAYVEAAPGRGTHEAKEMIDDRMLAPDAADRFLLQQGARTRLAGNLPAMPPRAGIFYLHYPVSGDGSHEVLGKGALLPNGLYAFVGRDIYQARKAEQGVLRAFGWVLFASIALASLSGLMLSSRFLKRIDRISDTCRAIMDGRLDDRIPAKGKRSELGRLAATINNMLDRNQALVESLRQMSSDIAHDLRTPLMHLRHSLEKARNEAANTDEYATVVDSAIAESDQMLAMFEALLRIARIEAGARREAFEDVDLRHLLQRAYDIYKPVMDDAGHPFTIGRTAGALVRGDAQLLLQAIVNLLENAIHHTPAGTPIRAAVECEGGRLAIVISDGGPGIAAEDRARVIRRFYRCEQSRTSPGNGLGLSLVSAVADLHGAELELSDNAPGLRVCIRFSPPISPLQRNFAASSCARSPAQS
jgi:signal transduction histidine kinase